MKKRTMISVSAAALLAGVAIFGLLPNRDATAQSSGA